MLTKSEWNKLERRIIRRDHAECQAVCGCTIGLSVHHIIPRDEGGSDDPLNLITLCKLCHDEIEDTDIRTLDRIRIFTPQWHDAVSWYETSPQRKTRIAKAPKKPKSNPKIAKPRGIHLRLDTKHVPEAEPMPRRKRRTPAEMLPLQPESVDALIFRRPWTTPTVEDSDIFWVHRSIMQQLLDQDEYFDPAEISQTKDAWEILIRWWASGEKVSPSLRDTLGIDLGCPIYDITDESLTALPLDDSLYRLMAGDKPSGVSWEAWVAKLTALLRKAEAELQEAA